MLQQNRTRDSRPKVLPLLRESACTGPPNDYSPARKSNQEYLCIPPPLLPTPPLNQNTNTSPPVPKDHSEYPIGPPVHQLPEKTHLLAWWSLPNPRPLSYHALDVTSAERSFFFGGRETPPYNAPDCRGSQRRPQEPQQYPSWYQTTTPTTTALSPEPRQPILPARSRAGGTLTGN